MGQIARAATITALGMGFGRALTIVREVVVAATFGISGHMDAWAVAFTLVGVPGSIIMGALQTALIPAYSRTSALGEKRRLLAAAVSVALLGMGTAAALLLGTSTWLLRLIRSDASPASIAQSAQLLWLLLPYYFFTALNLLGYGTLQAEKKFTANALTPILTPLCVIGTLLAWPGKTSVDALAIGFSIGALAEFFGLGIVLHRIGFRLIAAASPGILFGSSGVARQAMWLIPGTIISSAMPVIEQTLASRLGEGANAALAYGQRIPMAVNSLAAAALGMAVLPFFSEVIGRAGPDALKEVLARQARRLGALASVAALLLAVASPWIVRLLYERGAFDAHASALVSMVQAAYFLQLPGMLVGMLYGRAGVAQGRARMFPVVSAFTVMYQALTAWGLSSWLGLPGLGLAAATASILNAAVLVWFVSYRVPGTNQ